MKYAFLGAGNMASAIIRGMVKKNENTSKEIMVYATSTTHTKPLQESLGIGVANSRKELLQGADVLVLAVKPHILDNLVTDLAKELEGETPLIISIAAGKTLSYLESHLGAERPYVRIMPNINAKIGASTNGCCFGRQVSEAQKDLVLRLFESTGTVTVLPENMFSIFTVLAGSAPAFAYLYMDALARAAQKAGMPKAQALEIAASAVRGSAEMILQSGEHPWSLIDQVCSPGGTTIEGVAALEDNRFEATITKAFDAVLAKDLRIQNGK